MPKLIENLKDRLLTEAKQQIEQNGYEAVTIRSIAKNCGVGVGTVYNYFPSKEALIATHLLEDWKLCIDAIDQCAEASDSPQPVLRCMYDQLTCFALRHESLLRNEEAVSGFYRSFIQYHGLLRSQLAQPLKKYCGSEFASEFIAESLLTWTMAGKPFEELCQLLNKLF